LPYDFSPWKSVPEKYRAWKKAGIIEKMNENLTKKYRLLIGRSPEQTAFILYSQSVKTTKKGGIKGYDGGKKSKVGKGILYQFAFLNQAN
jgi:putative transposase